ncbi:hypothetical protein T459_00005 [Capsicum annuum]|uniref:Calpain-type cysteine protease DEK1 n=2 Tax=Capsicum annuum TaxID=4072 RepID=A0A2G3AD60_CAPAN|nr:hypothetical protein T459_00005 [Capsicum annuum]
METSLIHVQSPYIEMMKNNFFFFRSSTNDANKTPSPPLKSKEVSSWRSVSLSSGSFYNSGLGKNNFTDLSKSPHGHSKKVHPKKSGRDSSRDLRVPVLIRTIRILTKEKVQMASEVSSMLQNQVAERASTKEESSILQAKLDSRTRRLETEKNELQSVLEKELDRRSSDWSLKLEKYQIEQHRLRERERELAEQNDSLQREVSSFNEKEVDNRIKMSFSEKHLEDLSKRIEQVLEENQNLREKLYSEEMDIKKLQADLAATVRGAKKDENINQLTNDLQECMKELGVVKAVLPKVFQERDFIWEEVKSYSEMNMLLNYEINMLKRKYLARIGATIFFSSMSKSSVLLGLSLIVPLMVACLSIAIPIWIRNGYQFWSSRAENAGRAGNHLTLGMKEGVVFFISISLFAGSILALGAIVSAKPLDDLDYKGSTGGRNSVTSPYASSVFLGWAMASAIALVVTGVLPIISWFATYRFSLSSAICIGIFAAVIVAFCGVSYFEIVGSRTYQIPTKADFLASLLPLICIPAVLSLGAGLFKWKDDNWKLSRGAYMFIIIGLLLLLGAISAIIVTIKPWAIGAAFLLVLLLLVLAIGVIHYWASNNFYLTRIQMLLVCFLAFLLALAAFLVGWFQDSWQSRSISFGRFENEALCWERRSSFTHNRYLEEDGADTQASNDGYENTDYEGDFEHVNEIGHSACFVENHDRAATLLENGKYQASEKEGYAG